MWQKAAAAQRSGSAPACDETDQKGQRLQSLKAASKLSSTPLTATYSLCECMPGCVCVCVIHEGGGGVDLWVLMNVCQKGQLHDVGGSTVKTEFKTVTVGS